MPATIPRSYIENYSNSLNDISETAKAALAAALQKVDYSRPTDEVKAAVLAIMQSACGASTDVTAQLAARFYEGIRASMGGGAYKARANSMRDSAATEGAIAAFLKILVDGGEPDEFIAKCVGRLDYENRKAAKECIAHNARHDPVKPLWALVPTGGETCEYCIILASYGFVGNSQLVGHTHENCNCRLVPSWNRKTTIDGYQDKLAEYKAFYQDIQDLRKDMPYELQERIDMAKAKHQADHKSGLVSAKWGRMNELAIIARWIKANQY